MRSKFKNNFGKDYNEKQEGSLRKLLESKLNTSVESKDAEIRSAIEDPSHIKSLLNREDFPEIYERIRLKLTREHYREMLRTYKLDIPKQTLNKIQIRYRALISRDQDLGENVDKDRAVLETYRMAIESPVLGEIFKKYDLDSLVSVYEEISFYDKYIVHIGNKNPVLLDVGLEKLTQIVKLLDRQFVVDLHREHIIRYILRNVKSADDLLAVAQTLEIGKNIHKVKNRVRGIGYDGEILIQILKNPQQAKRLVELNPEISRDLLHLALLMYRIYGGNTDVVVRSIDDIFYHWSEITRKRINIVRFAADSVIAVAKELKEEDAKVIPLIDAYANEYSGPEYRYNNRYLIEDRLVYKKLENPSLWIEDRKFEIRSVIVHKKYRVVGTEDKRFEIKPVRVFSDIYTSLEGIRLEELRGAERILISLEEIGNVERILTLQYMFAEDIIVLPLSKHGIRSNTTQMSSGSVDHPSSREILRLDSPSPIRRLQLFGTAVDPNTKILAIWMKIYKIGKDGEHMKIRGYEKPLAIVIFRMVQDLDNNIRFLVNPLCYVSNYDVLSRPEYDLHIGIQSVFREIIHTYLSVRSKELGIKYIPKHTYSLYNISPENLSGNIISNSYFK